MIRSELQTPSEWPDKDIFEYEIKQSKIGADRLIRQGYHYIRHNNQGQTTSWRCFTNNSRQKDTCTASLTTYAGETHLTYSSTNHTCDKKRHDKATIKLNKLKRSNKAISDDDLPIEKPAAKKNNHFVDDDSDSDFNMSGEIKIRKKTKDPSSKGVKHSTNDSISELSDGDVDEFDSLVNKVKEKPVAKNEPKAPKKPKEKDGMKQLKLNFSKRSSKKGSDSEFQAPSVKKMKIAMTTDDDDIISIDNGSDSDLKMDDTIICIDCD